jgi:hypothetical protein
MYNIVKGWLVNSGLEIMLKEVDVVWYEVTSRLSLESVRKIAKNFSG